MANDESDFRLGNRVPTIGWIVSAGNFQSGIFFYGPFDGYAKAHNWALNTLKAGVTWNLEPLYTFKE